MRSSLQTVGAKIIISDTTTLSVRGQATTRKKAAAAFRRSWSKPTLILPLVGRVSSLETPGEMQVILHLPGRDQQIGCHLRRLPLNQVDYL